MKDIDIAIGILDKLIAREREAADNGMRMGNRILEENASARYHAYIMARDEIKDALAANRKDERIEAATDQADPASADEPGYVGRMRGEYRELDDRADKLRDMLQRYADGTLDFEPTCPIALLGRQLDVMDEYALILRRRASIEHIDLGERPVTGILRDTRPNKEHQ